MAKFNFLELIGLLLASSESIVPIFIHNPKSQQIEGVIAAQSNQVFAVLAQLQAQQTAGQQATPPTPAP